MEALSHWLSRLRSATQPNLSEYILRVFVPGNEPILLNECLVATNPLSAVPSGWRNGFPEFLSMLRFPDTNDSSRSADEHHRLSLDFASALSLAIDRRIDVPYDLAASVEGLNQITFLPFGSFVDPTLTGPLPDDVQSRFEVILRQISGLKKEDLVAIGAASTLFHGSSLLFERDVRSAYTLLVAGIEILSRKYGNPPCNWANWEQSEEWDLFISSIELSDEQANSLRSKLMKDKQLRLNSTFRAYASSRLPDPFWDQPWIEWVQSVNANDGTWLPATKSRDCLVRDILPFDRIKLEKALGLSYKLRSKFVHEGKWFGPLELSLTHHSTVDLNKPLPFGVLRAILGQLIRCELLDRTLPVNLPSIKILSS